MSRKVTPGGKIELFAGKLQRCSDCNAPSFLDQGNGKCSQCHGTGRDGWGDKCKRCHGSKKCPTCEGSGSVYVMDD